MSSKINDLINIIMHESTMSQSEGIEWLNEFAQSLKSNGNIGYLLVDEIEKEAKELNICPKCGEDLKSETWKEDRGEYLGAPVKEIVTNIYCEYCGWEDIL